MREREMRGKTKRKYRNERKWVNKDERESNSLNNKEEERESNNEINEEEERDDKESYSEDGREKKRSERWCVLFVTKFYICNWSLYTLSLIIIQWRIVPRDLKVRHSIWFNYYVLMVF